MQVEQLRSSFPQDDLRWSAPEAWHVTLQFLGSTKPEQYGCVAARLRELRCRQLTVELGSLGTFDRAGVLYLAVLLTPELSALQQAVTAATHRCGFTPEDRAYHPHITLARRNGKGGSGFRRLKPALEQQPMLAGFIADSFLLYESIPAPGGSRYNIRERFSLGVSR